MKLSEFDDYISNYEAGAKIIKVRKSFPSVNKNDDVPVKFKNAGHGCYDLNFSKEGLLLLCVDYAAYTCRKVFGYNQLKKPLIETTCKSNNYELQEICEFTYNPKGDLINETKKRFSYYDGEAEYYTAEARYTYSNNRQIIHVTNLEGDDDVYTYNNLFDNKGRLLEEKAFRNKEEFIFGFRYEYKDELVTTLFINEDGTPENQDIPADKNNKESAYEDYPKQYNEKGHWIFDALINERGPVFFYEREITYW